MERDCLCAVQLADSYIHKMTYKPSKLGQAKPAFALLAEFISRSVHTSLEVS